MGNVSARRLNLDRDRDGVAVVLDEVDDRQPPGAGGIQGFPELTFAGRPVPQRNVHNIAVWTPIYAFGVREARVVLAGFRAPDGVKALCGDRA